MKRGYREYYLRPSYIIGRLSQIRTWNDVKNIFLGLNIFFNVSKEKKV